MGRYRVRVDPDALATDQHRAPRAARNVLVALARELDSGTLEGQLRACDAEGRDGTQLAQCVKMYRPQPAGRYGVVLECRADADGFYLAYLAFGERHPSRESGCASVYEVAHQRLHRRSS